VTVCLGGRWGEHQHRGKFYRAVGTGSGEDSLEKIIGGVGGICQNPLAGCAEGDIGEEAKEFGADALDNKKFPDSHFLHGNIAM
jgi:hypothetical protein